MNSSSEETLEELHAKFSLTNLRGEELKKFGDKLRKKYFEQIERIEQKFQNVFLSNNQDDLRAFLLENNFIFRALSANAVIYNNCNIADGMTVDCILTGFKPFDGVHLWLTFIKLEQASPNIWDKQESLDNCLSPSGTQVKQWLSWQKTNSKFFESRIREQLRKDFADTEFLNMLDILTIQTDAFIVAGYKGKYNPKQPYLLKLPDDEFGAIKTITYDSLFKTIYEENNRTIMSSGWWTEDIRKTENAIVVNNVSFAG